MPQQPARLRMRSLLLYNLTGGRLRRGRTHDPVGILQLTTTGRKSGQPRAVSLVFIRDGAAYVVAASNAGRDRHPGWYFNLQSNPHVTMRLKDQQLAAVAEVASPDQRSRLWDHLVRAAPMFARYATRARRDIPMVLFHPAAGPSRTGTG